MNKYKNIDKIKPETLLSLFRDEIESSIEFKYINGIQPFFMSYGSEKYYVYIKNISSAYFSDRDKTTRAQLPIKPEFESIKKSPYKFIFLGYDGLNDVYICWNFHIAKERLNVGKSVSFYSRTFFQSDVKDFEFSRRRLKNGDLPVLFKRSNLNEFFKQIDTFFSHDTDLFIFKSSDYFNSSSLEEFIEFLKDVKKLSEKTISNYTSALNSKILEGIRKYFDPSLENIFFINNLDILERMNKKLFEKEEYIKINIKGKNMYSCAFTSYISFINNRYSKSTEVENGVKNDFNIKSEYQKEGKLLKITDLELLSKIEPYLSSNRLLSAVQIVGDYYQEEFPLMKLSDWFALVRNI